MGLVAAIRISDLKKDYREGFFLQRRLILKGISFEVPQGQMFGFLGANGAGKTTAIKIAMGLQSASHGTVEILGEPCTNSQVRARIGFLPERPYFHLNLTAREFLNFHRRLYGTGSNKTGARPTNDDLLKIVGLVDVRDRILRTFSKGMLQRIGVAQTLINDPELIILDEPMSGLDPVGRRELRNLLLDLNGKGKTIFFSSHILSDIESLCQQIAFLEFGNLKYCGKIEDLTQENSKNFEILFRPGKASASELAKIGKTDSFGMQCRIELGSESELRPAVERLWALGAEVTSLVPVHRSLEDILFGDAKKSGGQL